MALRLLLRGPAIRGTKLYQNSYKCGAVLLDRKRENTIAVVPVRQMSDHGKLYAFERVVAITLLIVSPLGIAYPNPILDHIWAACAVMHIHWGLEACVVDYIRPIIFGNTIPKISIGLLYLVSAATLGGLLYYNVNDIGIGQTVRKIWAIRETVKAEEEPEEEEEVNVKAK